MVLERAMPSRLLFQCSLMRTFEQVPRHDDDDGTGDCKTSQRHIAPRRYSPLRRMGAGVPRTLAGPPRRFWADGELPAVPIVDMGIDAERVEVAPTPSQLLVGLPW